MVSVIILWCFSWRLGLSIKSFPATTLQLGTWCGGGGQKEGGFWLEGQAVMGKVVAGRCSRGGHVLKTKAFMHWNNEERFLYIGGPGKSSSIWNISRVVLIDRYSYKYLWGRYLTWIFFISLCQTFFLDLSPRMQKPRIRVSHNFPSVGYPKLFFSLSAFDLLPPFKQKRPKTIQNVVFLEYSHFGTFLDVSF